MYREIRACSEAIISYPRVIRSSLCRAILLEQVRLQMSRCVANYCEQMGIEKPRKSEQISLLRYEPGGQYTPHSDGFERYLSCVVGLNDEFSGRESLLLVGGVVSRQEGTMNVVVHRARSIKGVQKCSKAKNWG